MPTFSQQTIVLKVGTYVLQQLNGKLDYNLIQELAKTIAELRQRGHEVLLVSSGAIGAGRERCTVLPNPPQAATPGKGRKELGIQQMLAAVGQVRLMQIYSEFFQEHQILVAQVLVTRADFAKRQSYLNIRNTIQQLLYFGILPIINENDVVSTEELPFFGDNDQLAVSFAALAGASHLFFLTSAPGLLVRKKQPDGSTKEVVLSEVKQVNKELLQHCQRPGTNVGRGGMESKVRAAGKSISFGINAYITSGKEPNTVLKILDGTQVGTHFLAHGSKLRGYRQWLAAGALSQGEIHVDAGAEQALRVHKKSLLLSGVCEVQGNFSAKDPVNIFNLQHELIGVGLAAQPAQALRVLLQQSEANRHTRAVIHRDDLFLADGHL